MERDAVKLHNKYVDEDRLKKRCLRRTNKEMASYYSLRYYKNRFERIKALGNEETTNENDELSRILSILFGQQQNTDRTSHSATGESNQPFEISVNLKGKLTICIDNEY